MEYALLIYENEAEAQKRTQAEYAKIHQAYMTFTEDIAKSGKMKGGAPLENSKTATTVRARNGKTMTTDGPFAETKEQLAGFYLVEAKDLNEAISIAARIPAAAFGSIEVRPVRKIEM
jgi:hypothetical protein